MNLKIRVAIISVAVNVVLVILKLLLARWSASKAILADAIHSLSDIFVSILVLSGLVLARQSVKRTAVIFRKIEDVVAIVVGLFILGAAVEIFTGTVRGPVTELSRLPVVLIGVFFCILVSGFIARLKIKVGQQEHSNSLVADGYHSRMDMYSSIGVLIGLVGTMVGLNLDVQAAALISLLIAATGLEVIYGGVQALLRGSSLEEYWLAGLLKGSIPVAGSATVSNRRILNTVLWFQTHGRRLLAGLAVLVFLLWALSGLYRVDPGERALVFRFGRLVDRTGQGPGLHYHLPWPFESASKSSLQSIRRLEIGFRTQFEIATGNAQSYQWESRHVRGRYSKRPEESVMFTGDENLVDINVIVQYRVTDIGKYLLLVEEPEKLIRSAAEEITRQVVGMEPLDDLFTRDRMIVEGSIQERLQETMERTDCGIRITAVKMQDVHPPVEVVEYFRDVASAREDKNRLINEAHAYRNEVLPIARGRALEQVRQAEARNKELADRARGEADRFTALLRAYQRARTVTEVRLFLEAVDETLPDLEKFIVEPDAAHDPVDLRFFREGDPEAAGDGAGQRILTLEER
jgi:membrane protease subunit HflK